VQARVHEVVAIALPTEGGADFVWYVKYRYADRSGARYEGKSGLLWHDPNFELEDGTGWIRYDPDHPGQSVWIGATWKK
jgi:hypothetical protein